MTAGTAHAAIMSNDTANHRTYSFGDFTLDVDRGTLFKGENEIRLRPQSFEVLRILVERHGCLVSKGELQAQIWGKKAVTDDSLSHCLTDIRKAVGDRSQAIIRTVPRRGYLFNMPVRGPGEMPMATKLRQRSVLAGTALVVVSLAAIGIWLALGTTGPDAADEPKASSAISVLPFVDLSAGQDHEFLADSVAQGIRNSLARVPQLRVIASNPSFSFNRDDPGIAEEPGITHVLEGSVRRSEHRIRISPRLIDIETGSRLWSETYDRELEDILQVQNDIAAAVAGAFEVSLYPTDAADSRSPGFARAREAFLRGQFFFHRRGSGDVASAEENYHRAIDAFPEHAGAWAGLASVYHVKIRNGTLTRDHGLALQREAIEQSLALEPDHAGTQVEASHYYQAIGDLETAARHFRKASELNPDSPPVLAIRAGDAAYMLRFEEATALQRRAVALEPLSKTGRVYLRNYLFAAGRFGEAKLENARIREFDPTAADETDEFLSCVLILEHRMAEALPLVEKRGNADYRNLGLALVLPELGQLPEASAAGQALEAHGGFRASIHLAELYAFRGNVDESLRWLSAAADLFAAAESEPGNSAVVLRGRISPYLRLLHNDPRWRNWIRATARPLLSRVVAARDPYRPMHTATPLLLTAQSDLSETLGTRVAIPYKAD